MLPAPLDLSGLWGLHAIDRPDLKDEPYVPVTHPDLSLVDDEDDSIFEVIGDRDVLVHHPYESFTTSVQRFIEEAAADPDVLAIKQTLYRTAGSPIVDALIEAAERGKQVVVLIEIKARFDESANIAWARTLEKAGCHVVYGLAGLKTHCKLCLVVREEGGHLRQYVHVGHRQLQPDHRAHLRGHRACSPRTRTWPPRSATCSTTSPASRATRSTARMIVAPHGMRDRMIGDDRARGGSLDAGAARPDHHEDEQPVRRRRWSTRSTTPPQQGVQVDLIVRSICTLRPGVKALSKNITVRSILGRFLEHSRIFYFQNGGDEEIYIGSADMMQRNLDRRVEALAAVKSPELREQLKLMLDLALSDNCSALDARSPRALDAGSAPPRSEMRLDFQEQLMRHSDADA